MIIKCVIQFRVLKSLTILNMAVRSQQLINLTREIAENLAISFGENERNRDPDYIPEEENEDQDETNDRFDEEMEIENNNN